MNTALQKAINHLDSQAELARKIGVSRQRLHTWLHKRIAIPPQFCVKIEAETGVDRRKLNKDFPWGEL